MRPTLPLPYTYPATVISNEMRGFNQRSVRILAAEDLLTPVQVQATLERAVQPKFYSWFPRIFLMAMKMFGFNTASWYTDTYIIWAISGEKRSSGVMCPPGISYL
jgi:hypothetical protein